ncbi:acyl-CoA dehydrogenase family protein [Novosphingobium cyanobacteriorum]|uniref:Acyl-CoA dehydrogenase family protein n=1 Tax=Novosphingobium cyanobacteriorum TaxID=3024215 RepID=A0ABT6CMU7_9SPHN|nr:acyl-CoA dehydrogenase family protein [Novosphingobium cyanobacteriorum]MDF8334563.1 acyl-CoA dehydrogenase family protein [Novosphingobium cyanobacteriorum]
MVELEADGSEPVNFDLTEDEEMLKALAERFVVDQYDIDRRRAYVATDEGFGRENWALLGELGLIAAPFAEEHGGLGLDATGIATVFEALGKGLVVEPLIDAVLLAGRLFAATAPEALAAQWIEGLLAGHKRLALAHAETGSRDGSLWVETSATSQGDVATLTGTKAYVVAGAGADGYVVSARTGGSPGDDDGLGLYFVEAGAAGLTATRWRVADGSVAVSLTLDAVPAVALSGGIAQIEEVEQVASLARSAEAVGIMQRLFDETLEYLRTREQFGTPLGQFQAIQHRMAAQYTALEQARALLNYAMVTQGTPEFASAVRGVRAFVAPAALELGHEMIQFHGGMGVTDELIIGHGHKRLLVISRWPDSPEAALDAYANAA